MSSTRLPRRFAVFRFWAGALALFAAVAGCGSTPATVHAPSTPASAAWSGSGSPDHILAVYQSHCGSCHRPVPPGSEPSDRLDAELSRHRKRARLTEQEWAGLGALLASRP
jgi:mono/diheme cytochrome c family protein